jgi:hypothetical protein
LPLEQNANKKNSLEGRNVEIVYRWAEAHSAWSRCALEIRLACTAGPYNLAQEEYWDQKSLRVAGLCQPPEAGLEFCVSIVSVRLPMHRSTLLR